MSLSAGEYCPDSLLTRSGTVSENTAGCRTVSSRYSDGRHRYGAASRQR